MITFSDANGLRLGIGDDMPMLDKAFEWEGSRSPNLDIVDRDNEILVRAEIPGREKQDLNISITGNFC
ncbi:Hsp20/alpha crystallin family protein [Nitrosomonas sp. Nm166]|uniref:Hsp20/alpha crystallin family protein n=1 Tax=Nitrosomonas sp. Nm166 TaxID=1881054 RepID=UPI000B832C0E|nr:Hsp20/alpha crystallin family protein [Nitrosomonas sp. Nm166]